MKVVHQPDMSYKCQVVDDLEALFKKQMFTDVMFCVDGKEFGAHKAVLAARSPVFVAMFKHEMLEQKCSVVNITDLSSEELEEMLRYIYTGKVLNLKRMGVALLAVADKYDLSGLKEICAKSLGCGLSVENSVDVLILADLYSVHILKIQAIEFINEHAAEVIKTKPWREMIRSHPQLLAEVYEAATRQGPLVTHKPSTPKK